MEGFMVVWNFPDNYEERDDGQLQRVKSFQEGE